jgi:hypothetical protein
MDMAQEGQPYEKDLRVLRARLLTVAATGDVQSPDDLESDDLQAQIQNHGQTGSYNHSAMWNFNRKNLDQKKNGIGNRLWGGGRSRFVDPVQYTGKENDPAQLIGHWRQEAHMELNSAMYSPPKKYPNQGAVTADKFEDIENCVDQIAAIAKKSGVR